MAAGWAAARGGSVAQVSAAAAQATVSAAAERAAGSQLAVARTTKASRMPRAAAARTEKRESAWRVVTHAVSAKSLYPTFQCRQDRPRVLHGRRRAEVRAGGGPRPAAGSLRPEANSQSSRRPGWHLADWQSCAPAQHHREPIEPCGKRTAAPRIRRAQCRLRSRQRLCSSSLSAS